MATSRLGMNNRQARLAECLQRLCKGLGVQGDDLIGLLQDELHELRQLWGVPVTDGNDAARRVIMTQLKLQIETLRPRIRLEPEAHYELVVNVSFNIAKMPDLHVKNLDDRRKWLTGQYGLSKSTTQRYLTDAVDQMAQKLASNDYKLARGADTQPSPAHPPQPSVSPLIHLVDLSNVIQAAFDSARESCKAQGRRFYTFDLLLALVDISGGRVWECFEGVREGLAQEIRTELLAMPAPGEEVHPYRPFDWDERSDVRRAKEYAVDDDTLTATELHLLLAVLDRESKTNLWLQRYMDQDYPKLRATAEHMRRAGPDDVASPTPY